MLHTEYLTPSQRLAREHQARFRANVAARAEARKAKVIPIVCTDKVQSVVIFGPIVLTEDDIAFGPVVIHDSEPEPPSCQEIIRATAQHFGVTKLEMISQRRHEYLVTARQVAIYMCQTLTSRSTPHIGKYMGNRDHTTVIHATRKIHGRILAGDAEIIAAVDAIAAKFAYPS